VAASQSSRATVILVGGARPNFVKLAPVVRALAVHDSAIRTRLVHTGQHYDRNMSSVFFEELGIPDPDVCLNVGSGSHGVQTARVMIAFEEFLQSIPKPSGVVVVGDVNSTVACTLTAAKLGIPVAHVEAGLRSFDRSMPEEINLVVTDALADLLLVSEPSGQENLAREGVPPERIHYVGNVMIDTLLHERTAARALDVPARFNTAPRRFGVVTLHRPSNVDNPVSLQNIVRFLEEVSQRVDLLVPLHPRTKARFAESAMVASPARGRLRLLDSFTYREMLALMDSDRFVITDSGGVQEETTCLGVPCLTLRENTERPITVTHGTNTIIGHDFVLASRVIEDIERGRYKTARPIEGWDGAAATRVADVLRRAWA